jgi:hypothetical protein
VHKAVPHVGISVSIIAILQIDSPWNWRTVTAKCLATGKLKCTACPEYIANWTPEDRWKDQPILSRNRSDPKVQAFMLLMVMMMMRRR